MASTQYCEETTGSQGLGTKAVQEDVRSSVEVAKKKVRHAHFSSKQLINAAIGPSRLAVGLNGRKQGSSSVIAPIEWPASAEPNLRTPTLHALQEWEGYVTHVGSEFIEAVLVDCTVATPTEEEIAEIPIAELADNDIPKVRKGSIFRWVIGHERSPSGTKKRVSLIVFRDLPVVAEQDRIKGQRWAEAIAEAFES